MIEVTVTIDFGPAGKQPFEAMVTVPEKSTVLDVLLERLPVTTVLTRYGMEHFVEEIDGVRNDFAADRGWRFRLTAADPMFLPNAISSRTAIGSNGCTSPAPALKRE